MTAPTDNRQDPYATANRQTPPTILLLAGLDPSGGAGLAADIATVSSLGGHALPLLTCQTIQDGRKFEQLFPQAPPILSRQFLDISRRFTPTAIKIGLLPDAAMAQMIGELLTETATTTVICDPVVDDGYGDMPMAAIGTLEAIKEYILPHCQLLTPNRKEVQRIGNSSDIDLAAANILQLGCRAVLVSSARSDNGNLTHLLYQNDEPGVPKHFTSPQQPGSFHGSGCTLSTAIATCYGHCRDWNLAIEQALDYTGKCIDSAWSAHTDVAFLRWFQDR